MSINIEASFLLQRSTSIHRALVDGVAARVLACRLCQDVEARAVGYAFAIMIQETNELKLWAASPQTAELQRQLEQRSADRQRCARCAVISMNQAIVAQDQERDDACHPCYMNALAAPWSCWSYPIVDGDNIIGTLRVSSHQHCQPSRDEADLLDTLASMAGILLCFERNQQTQQKQAQSLARLATFQKTLTEINAMVAMAQEETQFLQSICDLLVHKTGMKVAWVSRPNASGWFEVLAASGQTAYLDGLQVCTDAAHPKGRGGIGRTWREQRCFFNNQFLTNPDMLAWLDRARTWNIRSSATLPCLSQQRIWAVLAVTHEHENVYDEPLQTLLEELANSIARGLDLLARRQQEKHLMAVQGHLINNTRVGMTMVRNRRFILVNPYFAQILGYNHPSELIGQSTRIIYPNNEEYQHIGNMYRNVPGIGHASPMFQTFLLHKDGHTVPCETNFTLNEDEEGTFSIWTLIDISDRIQREQERNLYRDQLLRYAERVPGMLYKFRLAPDGLMSFPIALGSVREMMGANAEELQASADPAFARLHPDDYPFVAQSILESAQNMTPWHLDCRLVLDQGIVWRRGSSVPEREEDGSVVWYGFIADVTDQKNILEALQTSEAQLRAVFSASPAAMAVLDANDFRIRSVNPAWLRLLGRDAEQIKGKTLIQNGIWSHIDDQNIFQQHLTAPHALHQPMERTLLNEEGLPILCRIVAARTQSGDAIIMIVEDITLQRAAEQSIARMNQALELRVLERTQALEASNNALQASLVELQATQMHLVEVEKLSALGHLVAGIAHEINTPVGNSLLAATNLDQMLLDIEARVQQGIKRSDFQDFLLQAQQSSAVIVRNLYKAAELVTSFKQVAVDQNLPDNRRSFDLRSLILDHINLLQPRLKHTPISIRLDMDIEIVMQSLPGPLGQILTNLITNTLDHAFENMPAAPLIRIQVNGLEDDMVEIRVEDNGRGISAADLSHIFEPFFTTRLGRGGSGLGLHISYNATISLGGRLNVQSTEGQGTCFILRIPRTLPERNLNDV